MTTEEAIALLYDLKRDRSSGHEKPHKPVLLLAIMDLIETGKLVDNRVSASDELRDLFRGYFEIVKRGNDQCSPENPFYYLSGESFWQLVMAAGQTHIYDGVARKSAPSWRQLQARVKYAEIDPGLFVHMADPVGREILRGAIYSRYFAEHRSALRLICNEHTEFQHEEMVAEDPLPGRDAAFRKLVIDVYDYRCSACGLRLRLDNIVLVEAAHLIPWSESHDDNPRNGMALCRNHHYAMDRHLIAPTPDNVWLVSNRLDSRRDGESDLVKLKNQKILLPALEQYTPRPEALEWRRSRLLS